MEWFKNLKMSQKIISLVIFMVCFMVLVGGIGYYFNAKSSTDLTNLYKEQTLPLKWLNENRTHIRANEANLLWLILTPEPAKQKKIS